MNVHLAQDRGHLFRKIIAITLFRFKVQLGIALSVGDAALQAKAHRAAHPPDVPVWLREDLGLPRHEPAKHYWDFR